VRPKTTIERKPMARYLLSVHSVEGESRPEMTNDEMQDFMRRVGELEAEMKSRDVLLYSGRLAGTDAATVVRVAENGATITTDGPFAEAKEHLGGFYIINSSDLDEALSWGAKTSNCIGRPIEIRPFVDSRTG
jgi:hypothetical protein